MIYGIYVTSSRVDSFDNSTRTNQGWRGDYRFNCLRDALSHLQKCFDELCADGWECSFNNSRTLVGTRNSSERITYHIEKR